MDFKKIKKFCTRVAKKAGLDPSKSEIYYYDLDRICFICDGSHYTIRMWNLTETEVVEYTLFVMVEDKQGSHGVTLLSGKHCKL